ncbi:MAG: hypothetical protein LBS52_02525 [Dysgonamonadaceae bacterium]|jgi:hypothetical protein|nr:hypothetical protein [Dysgonamonadaceae bacterium]
MKIKQFNIAMLLGIALCGTGCSDEESLFSGKENYLTSFALIQSDGSRYNGVITSTGTEKDSIYVDIPNNVTSLAEFTTDYTVSELATLSPNPADITDWNQPLTFTVTSRNGQKRYYYYVLRRSAFSRKGNVTLLSDNDVAEFAAQGVNRIEGNLTIGKAVGTAKEDTITSIAALSGLSEVTGTIAINKTYGSASLDGLQNLRRVGNLEIVYPNTNSVQYKNLKEIALPALQMVGGNLLLKGDTLRQISVPELESVAGDFTVASVRLRALDLPKLQIVGGNFALGHPYSSGYMGGAEAYSIPSLTTVGGQLKVERCDSIKTISFPALKNVLDLRLTAMKNLESFEAPELTEVGNSIYVQSLDKATQLVFPALTKTNAITISNNAVLEKIDFAKLQQVGTGSISLSSLAKLKDLDGFASLQSVASNFNIQSLNAIQNVNGLAALKNVTGQLYLYNNVALTSLDGLNKLETVGTSLTVSSCNNLDTVDKFNALKSVTSLSFSNLANLKELKGFSALNSVGSFAASRCPLLEKIECLSAVKKPITSLVLQYLSKLTSMDLSGMQVANFTLDQAPPFTLKGNQVMDCSISLSLSQGIHFDGIKEIQKLVMTVNYSTADTQEYTFDIERVTGDLTVEQGYYANTRVINFPNLVKVGGLFRLTEGTYNKPVSPALFPVLAEVSALTFTGGVNSSFSLPKLQKVGGELSITTSFSNGNLLAELNDIDLPQLRTVGRLTLLSYANATKYNKTLTNLDFFANLERAESVNIQNQVGLVSYRGLTKVIGNLIDPDAWNVVGNGYNPTFEDLKAGKWEK